MNNSEEHSYLVNEILVALSKIPGVRAWKQTTGTFMSMGDGGHPFKVGIPGMSDIGLIMKCASGVGASGQVEVKTGTGKLRDQQKKWSAMIISHGGFFIEARDVEKTIVEVKQFMQDH